MPTIHSQFVSIGFLPEFSVHPNPVVDIRHEASGGLMLPPRKEGAKHRLDGYFPARRILRLK